jgi:hypothetical protein
MLRQHLFGMAPGGFSNLITARHAGDFVNAFSKIEGPQSSRGLIGVC